MNEYLRSRRTMCVCKHVGLIVSLVDRKLTVVQGVHEVTGTMELVEVRMQNVMPQEAD